MYYHKEANIIQYHHVIDHCLPAVAKTKQCSTEIKGNLFFHSYDHHLELNVIGKILFIQTFATLQRC